MSVRRWWNRRSREEDLDLEIRDHLELEADDRRAMGVSGDEAAFAARRRFGNVGLVKEAVRATWARAHWDAARQDLRYALRGLRRSPAFTITAILSLTLGIGANAAVFTLINALLLRNLPVPEPDRLVHVSVSDGGTPRVNFSYPAVRTFAREATPFSAVCGFAGAAFDVGPLGAERPATGAVMTGDCFRTFGVRAVVGRTLVSDDDQPSGGANGLVAVASYDYWVRELGRRRDVVGRQLILDGKPVTIVGVTPAGFTGLNVGRTADITLTVSAMRQLHPDGAPIFSKQSNWLRLFAHLAPGETREHAEVGLNVVWPRIVDDAFEPGRQAAMRASTVTLTPGGTGYSGLRTQFTKPLFVLMVIVGLVLLIACTNLASLLLARATARQREFSVRLAIGAGRGRLMRQVFTESLVLAVIGAVAATIFARFSSQALVKLLSAGRSPGIVLDLDPDVRVFAFAMVAALVTSVLFGLAPAFRATAVDTASALRESSRSHTRGRGRLASTLVVVQASLSLLLVVGGALFARTLVNLLHVDAGFRHDGVLLATIELSRALGPDVQERPIAQQLMQELRGLPGVTAASVSTNIPLSGGSWTTNVTVDGVAETGTPVEVETYAVSSQFFQAFGIPVRAGREFSETDERPDAARVAIVNEAFARERLGTTNPLGHRITISARPGPPMEIVGVVQSAASTGLRRSAPPAIYLCFFQQKNPALSGGANVELLTSAPVAAMADLIRQRAQAKVPLARVNVRAFRDVVNGSLVNERLLALLAAFFGALALALAAVGLYGLLAFGVSRRTTEIGVRTALGATRADVMWLVMSDALQLVGAGVAIGLPAVWATTRLVSGMLFGVGATDPWTIAGATGALVVTALVAAYLPARRAMQIDANVALKYE